MIWMLAAACGLAVANIYYAQPLLDAIAAELGIKNASVGIVITVTQLCYAAGLFLLVPLGDLLNRRKLIASLMTLTVAALAAVSMATNISILLAGLAGVGLLAVVAQVIVAYAASIASDRERGRVVGQVTSGIVTGILLARAAAGVLADLAGWRSVYLVSAALTLLTALVLYRALPHREEDRAALSYAGLLRSVLQLFIREPILRLRAALALFIFAAFSILWTSLVLPLSSPPLSLSHSAIGAFGLAGAAGALAAARAGRLADQGHGQTTTGIALALLLASWLPISRAAQSLPALILGVVILDLAVQAVHVTNQSMILRIRPEARSRLTAAYMIFYSIGSASGSIASTAVYARFGWHGVCLLGASVSAAALLFWALASASRYSKPSG
ncbi:MFS transporter [Paenibacillus doosanensis]|uniref:MFS transporter n=1 Tax=Paenibacillus doosanensis TaxID=1229154 RepID=UPI00217FEDB9|nr:MFS transporter [Paenibacillus doosanensis]MCS7463815.1 MFS transporter [Paenibacillus doosanensis]